MKRNSGGGTFITAVSRSFARSSMTGGLDAADLVQHFDQRVRMHLARAGEWLVDRDDDEQAGKDQQHEGAGHQRLRAHVTVAEEEGKADRDERAAEKDEPTQSGAG